MRRGGDDDDGYKGCVKGPHLYQPLTLPAQRHAILLPSRTPLPPFPLPASCAASPRLITPLPTASLLCFREFAEVVAAVSGDAGRVVAVTSAEKAKAVSDARPGFWEVRKVM